MMMMMIPIVMPGLTQQPSRINWDGGWGGGGLMSIGLTSVLALFCPSGAFTVNIWIILLLLCIVSVCADTTGLLFIERWTQDLCVRRCHWLLDLPFVERWTQNLCVRRYHWLLGFLFIERWTQDFYCAQQS